MKGIWVYLLVYSTRKRSRQLKQVGGPSWNWDSGYSLNAQADQRISMWLVYYRPTVNTNNVGPNKYWPR